MNRRTFLAAAVPLAAFATTARAQSPLGLDTPDAPTGLNLNPKRAAATEPAEPTKPAKKPQGPTEITAREGSLNNEKHQAIFSGEVEVKSTEFNINCDKLTIDLKQQKGKAAAPKPAEPRPIGADPAADLAPAAKKEDGDTASGIDRALAEGNVIIVQDKPDASGKMQKYTAVAKRAVYEAKDGVLTLYGWPKVSQSIGGNMSKTMVATEESCVMTLTRGGNISYKNGSARTTLQGDSAAK